MPRPALPLLMVSLLLPASLASAVEVPATFQYDSGKAVQSIAINGKPLPVGTILANGFVAAHRLRLTALHVATWGQPGPIELHVWRDDGGNQPGAPEGQFTTSDAADRMVPHKLKAGPSGTWRDGDLSAKPIELEPLERFWVGAKVLQVGTDVAIDGIDKQKTEFTGMVQTPEAVTQCADGCGIPGNLLLRAEGTYLDPLATTWFTDITAAAGINQFGRVAIADYDRDGDEDVLISGGYLWQNDGKAHFSYVSDALGLSGLAGGGGVWGDFDNDGRLDIFVFGGKEHLVRQLEDGHFAEVNVGEFTEDPTRDFPTEAASWVDIDNDGRLDLYTANYEVIPHDANGKEILDANGNSILGVCDWHFLWKQGADGHFHDVAKDYGFHTKKECGRSVTAGDWDQDGDQDIYVGNYRLNPNYFWENGLPTAHVTDIGKSNGTRGVGKINDFGHTIGATWVDADDDGDFDLFVANLAHPRFIAFSDRSMFYQNLGAEGGWGFTEHREMTGISYLETHSNPNFADFDNDGDQDLSLTAVYAGRKGQIWRNDGRNDATWLSFSDATYPTGWKVDNGWGSAWGDLDGDGDLDQVVNVVFRNNYSDVSGDRGHWLKVKLRGTQKVNAAAIGAFVTVDLGDGRTRSRMVHGGHGVGCQDALTLHFGLGQATQVLALTVHWPGLAAETFGPFAADQVVTLTEGAPPEGKSALAVDNADAGVDGAATAGDAVDASAVDAGAVADGVGGDGPGESAGAVSGTKPQAAGCATARASASAGTALVFLGIVLAAVRSRRRKRQVF